MKLGDAAKMVLLSFENRFADLDSWFPVPWETPHDFDVPPDVISPPTRELVHGVDDDIIVDVSPTLSSIFPCAWAPNFWRTDFEGISPIAPGDPHSHSLSWYLGSSEPILIPSLCFAHGLIRSLLSSSQVYFVGSWYLLD